MTIDIVDATPHLLQAPRLVFLGLSRPGLADLAVEDARESGDLLKCIRVDGEVVGLCKVTADGADVSIAVHPDFRRKRVATEALRLTVSEAFATFVWESVRAVTKELDTALGLGLVLSLKALGVREVGRRTTARDGIQVREIVWELRRADFKP